MHSVSSSLGMNWKHTTSGWNFGLSGLIFQLTRYRGHILDPLQSRSSISQFLNNIV